MANVINANDILIGTGKMYIDGIDVGQLAGEVGYDHEKEFYKVESGFPSTAVVTALTGEALTSEFSLLEANLGRLRSMMSEYLAVTETATESTAIEETVPVFANRHTRLKHSNITALTKVEDTATPTPNTLTEGTDFYIDRLTGNIYRVPGTTAIDDGEDVTVTYKYTSFAGEGFGIGGASTTSDTFVVEFVHKRRDGKYRVVRLWKCQVSGNFAMSFQEKAESPVAISLTAVADSTKPAGRQLGEILDCDAAPYGGW